MSAEASALTVDIVDVHEAQQRIMPFVHKTPVMTSTTLDSVASESLGIPVELVFKCENFQKVGAFKFRGATNAVRCLLFGSPKDGNALAIAKDNLAVITHSSGNHAQALALAARQQGVVCHVVMPSNAPSVKKEAVRGYGAIVTECEPTLQAREDTVALIIKQLAESNPEMRVEFISPYDDLRVIAGQGTLALELMEQAAGLSKNLDVVVAPVGGGGMLSGCAVAVKGSSPTIWMVGAEPSGADDVYRSFTSKSFHPSVQPNTVADGLLTSLGTHTFPLIVQHVDAIHTVTDVEILRATKLVYERIKIVIEPSAAVSLAVVLFSSEFRESIITRLSTKPPSLRIGVVFSGGNVDLVKLCALFQTLEPSE